MPNAKRGEVWLADLGFVAKTRPCLVLNIPPESPDRIVTTIVPHTTTVRGARFEIQITKKFLKPGAFVVQSLQTIGQQQLIKKLGHLSDAEMGLIIDGVKNWLGIDIS